MKEKVALALVVLGEQMAFGLEDEFFHTKLMQYYSNRIANRSTEAP
jgi:hypothetical protein